MPTLPRSESSLLVRTDFTSEKAWQQLCAQAQEENGDGFGAYIEPVSDPDFDHASWIQVKAAVPADSQEAAVLFVADRTTLTSPEHPVVVVDHAERQAAVPLRFRPAVECGEQRERREHGL